MNKYCFFSLLFLILLFGTPVVFPNERFICLNEDMGLSSRRSFSVVQDKNGFIWVSTKLSIDRYDGHQWVHYPLHSPEGKVFEKIGMNYIALSPDSSLWVFNDSGHLYRYDEQSDAFQFIYATKSHYQNDVGINSIFFEDNATVYLATIWGVLCLNVGEGRATSNPILSGVNVNHITKQDDLYYVSTRGGLFIFRSLTIADGSFIALHLKDQFVNLVYYDNKYQQFLIGTFSKGLYILPKRTGAAPYRTQLTISKPIRSIIPYDENRIAIGIDGEGVLLVDRKTMNVKESIVSTSKQTYSPGSNSVQDMMLDIQKRLWITTYHAGVFHTDRSLLNFRNFVHDKGNPNSVSDNYINAVYEDRDGDLWFGTNDGLSLFYRKTGKWKHFFQDDNPVNKSVILTISEDPDGRIWVGGYAFGIAEIDKKHETVKRYHSNVPHPMIGTDNIYAIYIDKYSADIWTGGIYGEIACYDLRSKQTRFFMESSVRCFCFYDDSTVVLGLSHGLFLLNKETGERQATRIRNISVNSILRTDDKVFWVGTMGHGLFYYDLGNDSLRNYTQADGLSSNHVYSIEKDDEGNLWLSTENGLNRFSPHTDGTVIRFNKQDGLISNQYTPNSSFRCSTGEILFGSVDGVVLFDPAEIQKNNIELPYPLVFTGFSLLGAPVEAGIKDSPLVQSINNTVKITLPYNKNYFSLTFTLPNYQSSWKTEYSYFLKGYDLDWSKPSVFNSTTYSKIPPGKYTFYVRAYVEQYPQKERQLLIIVNQPWWNSVWAWTVYVLISITIAYIVIRYYSERRKKKQTEEKVEFFINTAHDILTPLSLIETPLKDLSAMNMLTEEMKYLLSLALNNTRKLSHFVHQLIDFQKNMLNADRLIVSQYNVKDFFVNKANAYRIIASQKFISLDVHLPETEHELLFDKEKLGRILDNLLSNAIKYTPFGGKIELHLFCSGKEWGFSVKDTGPGISKRNQNLIFKHIFRGENEVNAINVGSGIGLKMTHVLVRIHCGKISFISKEGEGTEFTVTLPYSYNEEYIVVNPVRISANDIKEQEKETGRRILIVESEPEMSLYLQHAFSREYSVGLYTTGKEAFNHINRFRPELIIVDASLSDMDGFSFCRKIKDNPDTSHIPLVMITGMTDSEQTKKIFLSGAVDFIKKPFEFEILNLKISNILFLGQTQQDKALKDIKTSNMTVINNNRDQEFMDNLIQVIEQNLDNPQLNIAMLCRELGLSRTLLYNRITQLTNDSPNKFIRNIRLKNAANLLLSGQYTITEISYMVGIDNQKYFSRIFKEYFKVSPKDYGK